MNIVVAVSENNGIGLKNSLPWKLPNEYAHFLKQVKSVKDPSKKNGIIVSRKGYEEFSQTTGTSNFVIAILTRKKNYKAESENAFVFNDLEKAYEYLYSQKQVESVFNIGGGEIYKLSMNNKYLKRIYITRVFGVFECDTFFPVVDLKRFKRNVDYDQKIHEENGVKYQYQLFERIE